MNLTPSITFSVLVATFLGALGHLIVGGNGRRMAILILSSWIGFGIGEAIGSVLGGDVASIGTINIVPASFGAIVGVLTASVLTSRRLRRKQTR